MKRPPMLMCIKIELEDRKFGLWLPLFLLLPLALVVLIILSPLILVAVVVLWSSGWGRWALSSLSATWAVFYSMRGLMVDIKGHRRNVYIQVV